jgi:hypothetical protein
MWELQPLATLTGSTACTGITLPYLTKSNEVASHPNLHISQIIVKKSQRQPFAHGEYVTECLMKEA